MAQFHVGQRVRIAERIPNCRERYADIQGAETTITGPRTFKHGVHGYRTAASDKYAAYGLLGVEEEYLAPLTDPSAERFIESIKRLGREPINDAPKVTVSK